MKNKLRASINSVLIVLAMVSSTLSYAQQVDTARIRCTYKYEFIADLLEPTRTRTDEMILLIGDSLTSFYSYKNYLVDSLRKANPAEYAPEIVRVGNETTVIPARINLPRNIFNVEQYFLERSTGEIQCMEKLGDAFFSYKELASKPDWEICPDTCYILGYLCQKSTANYGGRGWTAWFAHKIPIGEGPWKLRGLPGLILRAEDAEKHFTYTCVGLEVVRQPIKKDNQNNYRNVSKKEFFRTKRTFFEDPIAALGGKQLWEKTLKFKYNFIEMPPK